MAYKLSIVDKEHSLNIQVRYENLARAKKPEIVAKEPNGKPVKIKTVYQGNVLPTGSTQKKWMDDQDQEYSKAELTFWMGDQEVSEIEQTKVFEIEGYQPLGNYTDNYVIPVYYELYADDNGMKKDIDRQRAINANNSQMRKLWEYLDKNKLVGRGEFCPGSRGFIASDGYIRAIRVNGNKWGLEIGCFKEEKVFTHLQEGTPKEIPVAVTHKTKRVKMV